MTLLAFDRPRLDSLRLAIGDAVEDLARIRCDDPDAADEMLTIRLASRTLSETCLPRVLEILQSQAMTSYHSSGIDGCDVQRFVYSTAHDRGWEVTSDPVLIGPPAPRIRTFDEVLADVRSGALIPMTAPLDANGHAGVRYTSLAFASDHPQPVDTRDVTSNLLKFLDFMSDGLPVGWREHQTIEIYYLTNARITSAVHVLTAYDRDEGPETLIELTTEASASGYMVIRTHESVAEVSIGPDEQDPTQGVTIASQSSSAYSGMFFPVNAPKFKPVDQRPRFQSPDRWTFTTSSAPMTDHWGTWDL
ncbi:MAG: hypothetical protein ABI894_02015 [Ilumatobacteraceae bacterium]